MGLRKKMVLIEKLQSQVYEERQKHRLQTMKTATDTIKNDEADSETESFDPSVHAETGSDDRMHIDNGDTDNDCDDDLEFHNGNERKSKEEELDRSKKLLNMFCSPRHSKTQSHAQQMIKPKASGLNTSLSLRLPNDFGKQQKELTTPVINRKLKERISVQLTPFHTPNAAQTSKLGRSRLFCNKDTGNNVLSAPAHLQQQQTNANTNHNNGMDIASESPLLQHSKSDQNMSFNHTLPVVNKQNKRNVFSRLTNPKHFTATSRTRAQELEALKHKIKKQKDSHTNMTQQKRVDWFAQKSEQQQQQQVQNELHPHDFNNESHIHVDRQERDREMFHAHIGNGHDENHKANASVFRRLHKTQIRNVKPNLNCSMNSNQSHHDLHMEDSHNDSGILLKPTRVVSQNEIHKKAQRDVTRNMQASKSMLTAPVRMLTPDDEL